MIKLVDLLKQLLEEDRCKRIADRKYDKPSAYKSGAIVRCRKGNIWKDLKEEEGTVYKNVIKYGKGYLIPSSHYAGIGGVPEDLKDQLFNNVKEFGYYYEGIGEKGLKGNGPEKEWIQNQLNINNPSNKGSYDAINLGDYSGYTIFANLNENPDVVQEIESEYKEGDNISDILTKVLTKGKGTFERIKISKEGTKKIIDYCVADGLDVKQDGKNIINFLKQGEDKMWNNYPSSALGKYAQKATSIRRKNIANMMSSKGGLYFIGDGHIPEFKSEIGGEDIGSLKEQLNEKVKETLRTWFKRKGAPGKEGGWVDCNTCRDGKCKSCGRKKGEKRSKYPSCRPTPAQCKSPGKGKKWGKTK